MAPFLVGVKPSDLPPPLTQFNAVFAEKEELKRLLKAINERVPEEKVDQSRIEKAVDALWSSIEGELKAAEEPPPAVGQKKTPSPDAGSVLERIDPILQELLVLNRQQNILLSESSSSASRRIAEYRAAEEERRALDRNLVAELVAEVTRLLRIVRVEKLEEKAPIEAFRIERLLSVVSERFEVPTSTRLRSRRGRSEETEGISPIVAGLTFVRLSPNAANPDHLASRVADIVPITGYGDGGSEVEIMFNAPISARQRSSIADAALELGYRLSIGDR